MPADSERDQFRRDAIQKRKQLEREITESSASSLEKQNMRHTLEKLWMFASDAIDESNGSAG